MWGVTFGLLAVIQTILSLSSRWRAVAFAAPPFVTFSASDWEQIETCGESPSFQPWKPGTVCSPERRRWAAPGSRWNTWKTEGEPSTMLADGASAWATYIHCSAEQVCCWLEGPESEAGRSREAPGGNAVRTSDIKKNRSVEKGSAVSNKGFLSDQEVSEH